MLHLRAAPSSRATTTEIGHAVIRSVLTGGCLLDLEPTFEIAQHARLPLHLPQCWSADLLGDLAGLLLDYLIFSVMSPDLPHKGR